MKISRLYSVPAAICLVLLMTSPARTAEFPVPNVGFSADVKMVIRQSTPAKRMIVTGKIHVSREGNERREMVAEGQKTIVIWRQDKEVAWMLLPQQKTYMETRGGNKKEDPERMIQEGKVKFTRLGPERVNGLPTTKYRMEGTHKEGDRFIGHRWVTRQNVPVRMEGTIQDRHFQTDYTNIKIGRQNPRLFELPPGYQRMALPPMPASPPTGLRGRGQMPQGPPPGMSKKQWEDMKKTIEQMQRQQGGKY